MIPDAFNFTVIFHHKFLSPPSPRQGRQGPIASDVDSLRLTIGPQASLLEQGMCLSRETDLFLGALNSGALNPFLGSPIDGYISFFGEEDEELTKIWGYTCAFRQTHVGGRQGWIEMSENERERRMSWKTGIGSREKKPWELEKVPVCSLSFEHSLGVPRCFRGKPVPHLKLVAHRLHGGTFDALELFYPPIRHLSHGGQENDLDADPAHMMEYIYIYHPSVCVCV